MLSTHTHTHTNTHTPHTTYSTQYTEIHINDDDPILRPEGSTR